MSTTSIRVFYDGLCHLCYQEVRHYQRCRGSDQIEFVDITAPQFSATAEGLDPREVNRQFHVRRANGSMAVGVDAFIEIWKTLPRYRFLARFASLSPVRLILQFGYYWFAKIRPYFPKRKAGCESSPYCATQRR